MRTVRIICLCCIAAGGLFAQAAQAPSATALEAAALQKTAEWQALAQGLSTNIGRLLPCDPKATAAIDAVSKASEARLAAVAAYLQAAALNSTTGSAEAKRLINAAQTLAADLAAEKIEMGLEQTAIDGQFANLSESVPKQPALAAAQGDLKQIQAEAQGRLDAIQTASLQQQALSGSLPNLAAAADARAAAWKDLQVAYEAERARWNTYYAARIARAQMECTITRGVNGSDRQSKGKQR